MRLPYGCRITRPIHICIETKRMVLYTSDSQRKSAFPFYIEKYYTKMIATATTLPLDTRNALLVARFSTSQTYKYKHTYTHSQTQSLCGTQLSDSLSMWWFCFQRCSICFPFNFLWIWRSKRITLYTICFVFYIPGVFVCGGIKFCNCAEHNDSQTNACCICETEREHSYEIEYVYPYVQSF